MNTAIVSVLLRRNPRISSLVYKNTEIYGNTTPAALSYHGRRNARELSISLTIKAITYKSMCNHQPMSRMVSFNDRCPQ